MITCSENELVDALNLVEVPMSEFLIRDIDGTRTPAYRGPDPRNFALGLAMAVAETRAHEGSGDIYAVIEATADIGEPRANIMCPEEADVLIWGSVELVEDQD